MCSGMRFVDCPVYDGMFSTLVGCVFQWGVLACVSCSFMVRLGFGRWSNFSCIVVSGVMFWHIRFSLCAPEPHGEGASKEMMGLTILVCGGVVWCLGCWPVCIRFLWVVKCKGSVAVLLDLLVYSLLGL